MADFHSYVLRIEVPLAVPAENGAAGAFNLENVKTAIRSACHQALTAGQGIACGEVRAFISDGVGVDCA